MDSLIAASARALAAGDVLGALQRVALRDDPPALALRGIALARLGELTRSRELLRQAARGFGRHEALARARCVVAEAEVALALRDLAGLPRTLHAAAAILEAGGDLANAQQAQLIAPRRALLLGRLDDADALLAGLEAQPPRTPTLAALAALIGAELALRRLRTAAAREFLERARRAAAVAGVPALQAEVDELRGQLARPAARRRLCEGEVAVLRLDEVEALLDSGALVVDACRRGLRSGHAWWSLARRPVLFALVRALAEAGPAGLGREALIERAFRQRRPDETHRARLRVEIGRLRALLAPLAQVLATPRGYALVPRSPQGVALLLPPIEGDEAALRALLADGAAWSTSGLALALGSSQRSVQRALAALQAMGHVRTLGRGRAQRWLAPPLAGFTTILLLPAALPFA